MADLEIKEFEEFNPALMGKPWVAEVSSITGKLDFTIKSQYSADIAKGEAGSLIVNDIKSDVIYAFGQKDKQLNKSIIEYAKYDGKKIVSVPNEIVIEIKDRYYSSLPPRSEETIERQKENKKIDRKMEKYQKFNDIQIIREIPAYNPDKLSTPWVSELTSDGISFDSAGNPDSKIVGRVVGDPHSLQKVFVVNPKPDQVFAVGQKDLESNKYYMHFYRVESQKTIELSRKEAENIVGVKHQFKAFNVKEKNKIILNMPDGYDPKKYKMWIAREIIQDNKKAYQSLNSKGEFYGNYSGGHDGKPGQFYIKKPEENAKYVVWQKDIKNNKSKMIAATKYVNAKMESQEITKLRKIERVAIKSMPAFDNELFENPIVAKIRSDGSFQFSNGLSSDGNNLRVGYYTGRKNLGEAGNIIVFDPKDKEVFAVLQQNNKTLRNKIEYYQYDNEKVIAIDDRQTAIELAGGKNIEVNNQKPIETPSVENKAISNVEISKIAAYDKNDYNRPHISKMNEKGEFELIRDKSIAEYKGTSKGGTVILHDAKEGDIVAYGQTRKDNKKTKCKYALVEKGQVKAITSRTVTAKQKQLEKSNTLSNSRVG